MLILSAGCDRALEPDLAGNGAVPQAVPVEAVDPSERVDGGSSVGEPATPSIPATPLVEPKTTSPPLDPPPIKLGIGDANPGLQIAKWVKGDPVEEPLTSKVHVVEFWATWCGPCRVGMPHISELQKEYGDEVAFIGVTREDEEKVTSFLEADSPQGESWDEVIQYRLAIDEDGWTNDAYMRAAGQNGIPCAFVVGRDGIVEWIGHPASIDQPLKQIVEGNWDREAAIVEYAKKEKLKGVAREISQHLRSKDWDSALALLDEFDNAEGESTGTLNYRLSILESAGRSEEASAVRAKLVENAWDDAQTLNQIAWGTATRGNGDTADLELALKAARRAAELGNDKDASVLDTLARCHYVLGNLDEAIKWQRLAVEHNTGLPQIDAALESYLKEKAKSEEPGEDAAEEPEPSDESVEASASEESAE